MAEENKEEKKEEKKEPAAPQAAVAPSVEAKDAGKPAEGPKEDAAKKAEQPAAVKKEKPANCSVCNKSIRKKRCYYRNGKYYCTKRCWQTTLKKEGPPVEGDAGKK